MSEENGILKTLVDSTSNANRERATPCFPYF